MKRRPMTVHDLWALPRVGAPAPAPDGSFFVAPVATYSLETNEGTTRLWLVPASAREAGTGGKGDPARPLTSADVSSTQPAVSPDGKHLAFVRKPGAAKGSGRPVQGPKHPDMPQLYVLPLTGGEPERLTDLPLGVADPRWFPDGKRLAFLAFVYQDALTPEEAAKKAEDTEKDPVKAAVTEDRFYRYWDRWLTDGKVPHIFAIDLETRAVMDLTPDSRRFFDFMEPADQYFIAPDGREIAFAACRSRPPYDPILWGVFTVPVPDRIGPRARAGKTQLLSRGHPADAMRPVYSPDGRFIVYGIQREIDFYADRVRLVAYDRRSKSHTVLTEGWDRSAMAWVFGEDPGTVLLTAENCGRTSIYALDLKASLAHPDAHPPLEIHRGGTHTAPRPAGSRIFTTLCSLSSPPEVVSMTARGTDLCRHTLFTGPGMDGLAMGSVEEFIFEGHGREPVQMLLVRPPGAPAAGRAAPKKLPLVQMVHGGPHGVFGDSWHWRWNAQLFASPGYLVALVNFHGSTSWGQDFAASILGRWGDQPYHDVMAATDALLEAGLVDPARMAVAGGSYGGYLAAWIASQTDRFACFVNHAGVADFQTQYASDVTQGRARSMGGEPWADIEGMDRYNPVRHARGFRSPMLVIHGEKDYRVPHAQGLEIYNMYKARRLEARLVVYPDENHWILKPRNSVHWYGEVLGWLDRFIGNRPLPRPRSERSRTSSPGGRKPRGKNAENA